MALGIDIYAGADGMRQVEQSTRVREKGKRKRMGQLEIWRYARRHRRRYEVHTPAAAGASRRSADRTCRMT